MATAKLDWSGFDTPAIDDRETIFSDWHLLKRWRRQLAGCFFCLPDTGWLGLRPLRTHIVVCGLPRSGTTLLQLMLEYALPHARRFGREVSGWRAAMYRLRNHRVMISKAPADLLRLHRLHNFYRQRTARLRPIVMLRDPRDALTSYHAKTGSHRYFVSLDKWRKHRAALLPLLDSPRALVVRYEDLVTDTAGVQQRIDSYTGEPTARSFAHFHQEQRATVDLSSLNGLRPVDDNTVQRWQSAEHIARIEEVLREDPQFGETLIALGYESSTAWIDAWRAASSRKRKPPR
ncbi:MAG: sulfotransferase domain-containing protein [Planctomycetes bacterium]|nr:sulfotransferase domain-containing protein [Planctomycetota bacterium]